MPKIAYISKKFNPVHQQIVNQANAILDEYAAQGFDLTLRQLYYQFVARDLFPERWIDPDTGSKNSQKNYKKLGDIINDARLAGEIDWNHIVDRTRAVRSNSHWSSPRDILAAVASQYAIDKWAGQDYYVEVWVEKEALAGVVGQICARVDVPYFSCRGYVSASEMWRAAERLKSKHRAGRKCVVLHLGDHDPSGIDMSRDIKDRLGGVFNAWVHVKRIALTMEQVEAYNPPPNPAKETDSRFAGYLDEYGDESWELDALDPTTLQDLIEEQVEGYRDSDLWDQAVEEEERQKAQLGALYGKWGEIAATL